MRVSRPVRVLALVPVLALACASERRSFDPEPVTGEFTCGKENDCDDDGYAAPEDCNDQDKLINPGAYDFPGDNVDNDCDGTIDNPTTACETIPSENPGSPTDFARAADICAQPHYDPLIKAAWGQVKGYGPGQRLWTSETKKEQVGIVTSFGENTPRRGKTMMGLATGPWNARDPRSGVPLDGTEFHIDDACKEIPLDANDCRALSYGSAGGGVSVQDWAELRLWLKVPTNAGSGVIDFSFFSTEFNQFWNASLNDAFFILVSSQKRSGQNVATDTNGLGVTVNSGFFQLCPKAPGPPGLAQDKAAGLQQCVGVDGDSSLGIFGSIRGTGYDGAAVSSDYTVQAVNGNKYVYGGGTGWLSAKFPTVPGEELMVRVIVLDTFDGLKDSAVIVDGFRWEPDDGSGASRPVR
ncbi:MAG: putative metal-binding motif-containing protein [Labilithrix sp.]|nr:putative metal-binding motif-containing protein [Labilithrix sp.]